MSWLPLVGLFLAMACPAWAEEGRKLFLTFDDGPREGTRAILEVLTREQIPGTFFLVGDHFIDAGRRETWRMLRASPLVQIGNHSMTHAHERYRAFYADPEGMLADFSRNNQVLEFLNPPYPARLPSRIDWRFDDRYVSERSYPTGRNDEVPEGIAKLFANGFVLYGWDVEWGKSARRGALEAVDSLFARIRNRFATGQSVKPGKVVVLMHDFHFNTGVAIEQLKHLIRLGRREGYRFGLIRDY
ncbi:MAG: polysaccharide deacetylase family protein [Magnetococcales bacterium]|nr:polysaccharide deacetylase family protein [Magnetococcales bacterium]